MSSSGLSKPFRLTLLRVAENLTKKNVQDLAFLCDDITPARRDELKDGRDLFAALQGHDLLSETNVNTLVEWLDELRLLEASKILRDYRKDHLKPTSPTREMCLIHDDLPLKYFCVSCESKLCPDCVVTSHGREKNCDVVNLDKVKDEIATRRVKLTQELDDMKITTQATKQLVEEKEKFLAKCRDMAEEEANRDYLALLENAEKNKRAIIRDLDGKRISDMANILEERRLIQSLENEVEYLKKKNKDTSDHSLQELQKVNRAIKGINDIRIVLDQQKEEVKKKIVDISYRKISNDGSFGVMAVGNVVGTLNLGVRQLLRVVDERHANGSILLICIEPEKPHKEHWRYSMKVDDHKSPIVHTYISMFYDGTEHVLVAVGRKVYIVHANWASPLYDSVEKVETLEIDDVPKGSWITSICINSRTGGEKNEEFVISINGSTTLREYKVSGTLVQPIETKDHLLSSGIAGIAYCTNKMAIISRDCNNITLILVENTVKQCGSIMSPSADLYPAVVIWTGAEWLGLFKSTGTEVQWKVISFSKTGKLEKEVVEGTSSDVLKIPHSLTRSKRTGYAVSLSEVITFEY